MTNWDEIRTAYQVARLGTVSGAAEALGVHHATVIRHVDALETRLGAKLFQRHARGYTPTEAGRDLLSVAQATDDQFAQLVGRIKGQDEGEGIRGELVVTSLAVLSRGLAPIMVEFQEMHPAVTVRYLTGDRLFRLEYGEAHVAVRAGPMPDQPDNVVQPFVGMRFSLVASEAYLARHGQPEGEGDLAGHRFVGLDDADNSPLNRWMAEIVALDRIGFRVNNPESLRNAILAGAGIGFVSDIERRDHPTLREVVPARDGWSSATWLVTHVDLHRTTKVQAILTLLKERTKGWVC